MSALHLTSENWKNEVLESTTPVLVDFWAPWCAPCRMIAPAIDNLASEFEGRVKVAKLNVDEEADLASAYGISSIPALLVFRGGQVVDHRLGAAPPSVLHSLIAPHAENSESPAQA